MKRRPTTWLSVACIAIALCPSVRAANDSLAQLQGVLRSSRQAPADADARLTAAISQIQGTRDLGRALILNEWRLDDWESQVATLHRVHHERLARLYERAVLAQLASDDSAARRLLLSELIEICSNEPKLVRESRIGLQLSALLAQIMRDAAFPEFELAARALALCFSDVRQATLAFETVLLEENVARRRAAADGLMMLIQARQKAAIAARGADRARCHEEWVATASATIHVAGKGLHDPDITVRKHCATAFELAGNGLHAFARHLSQCVGVGAAKDDSLSPSPKEPTFAEFQVLATVLREQSHVIQQALTDFDSEIRLIAARTLEAVAAARVILDTDVRKSELQQAAFVSNAQATSALLLDTLRASLPALADNLRHPDVRVRRRALDVFESMGPEAEPALAVLLEATTDPDRFVRWGAVRTLQKSAPLRPEAIKAFERLRGDPDSSVRRAAHQALPMPRHRK